MSKFRGNLLTTPICRATGCEKPECLPTNFCGWHNWFSGTNILRSCLKKSLLKRASQFTRLVESSPNGCFLSCPTPRFGNDSYMTLGLVCCRISTSELSSWSSRYTSRYLIRTPLNIIKSDVCNPFKILSRHVWINTRRMSESFRASWRKITSNGTERYRGIVDLYRLFIFLDSFLYNKLKAK